MKIFNEIETINKLRDGYSICRYGDGEMVMIVNKQSIGFQHYDTNLQKKLIEILNSDHPKLIVGIPPFFGNAAENAVTNSHTKKYWDKFMTHSNSKKFTNLLAPNKNYYSSFITRLESFKNYDEIVSAFKKVWNNKKILVVINQEVRSNCNNTLKVLFHNVRNIDYYLIPKKDAYLQYNKILSDLNNFKDKDLVLISAGPTAKLLVYDITKNGKQAIDFGHFIELYSKILAIHEHRNIKYHAYCINLDARQDRIKNIIKSFSGCPFIAISRLAAIKHQHGWIGCTLSHIKAIKEAAAKKAKYCIVLEDDCIIADQNFNVRLVQIMNWLENNYDKWDIFNGNPNKPEIVGQLEDHILNLDLQIMKIDDCRTANFIIYNSTTFNDLLSIENKITPELIEYNIDRYVNKFKVVTSLPFLTTQYSSFSNILNKSTKYDKNIKKSLSTLEDLFKKATTKPVQQL